MKVKDLIPVIEGQLDGLIIGTEDGREFKKTEKLDYREAVEEFLLPFKNREVIRIWPKDESILEITIK